MSGVKDFPHYRIIKMAYQQLKNIYNIPTDVLDYVFSPFTGENDYTESYHKVLCDISRCRCTNGRDTVICTPQHLSFDNCHNKYYTILHELKHDDLYRDFIDSLNEFDIDEYNHDDDDNNRIWDDWKDHFNICISMFPYVYDNLKITEDDYDIICEVFYEHNF